MSLDLEALETSVDLVAPHRDDARPLIDRLVRILEHAIDPVLAPIWCRADRHTFGP